MHPSETPAVCSLTRQTALSASAGCAGGSEDGVWVGDTQVGKGALGGGLIPESAFCHGRRLPARQHGWL